MEEPPRITVYGAHWCPDCRRSRQFLGEYQTPYNWVDIERDKEGEQYVLQKNNGLRIIPTIEFADGSILVEPSNAELAAKLGLQTTVERSHYDLIIVGGGPTGLTAALYTAREGIDTLVIERAALGGQAAATQWLDNVPGFPEGIEGANFADRLRQQAARFGVDLLQAQEVVHFHSHHNYHCAHTTDGHQCSARALLLATGSQYRRLGIPGEDRYYGAGVHYCATCDGPFYKDLPVVVIGAGNSATEESLFLLRFVERVTLLVRGDELNASQILQERIKSRPAHKVDIRFHTEAVAFRGERGKLSSVTIRNNQTSATEEIRTAGVFVFIGQIPNTGFMVESGVRLDPQGFILTGHDLIHSVGRPPGYEERDPYIVETSVPGIFAAGDVRSGSTKQVASSTGEGATAALAIHEYLDSV